MVPLGGRKQVIEIADDLRSVTDHIFGEEHRVQRVVLQSGAQRLFIEGAVDLRNIILYGIKFYLTVHLY